MSKDNYRLRRLGVLAPAALSACMDASVLAVPAAGAIVSTVLKELSKAFMLKKWFHGNISAKEAELLMMEKGKNGSFLVRESRGHPGDFVLSVRVRGRVSHVMIKKQHNKYDVGSGEQFEDLVGLIEHFRAYPMIEASGDVLRLLQPISASLKIKSDHTKSEDITENDYRSDDSYKCGYDSEFDSLQSMDMKHDYTTNEAIKPENIDKNRYRNILPYDHTRVYLQKNDGTSSDYINANYVFSNKQYDSLSSNQSSNESLNSIHSLNVGGTQKNKPLVSKSLSDDALRELKGRIKMDKINGNQEHAKSIYIATQGCLSTTQKDFWRMIWQEDVRIIVMITKEYENGKKKCEKYWPDKGEIKSFEILDVRLKSECFLEDYLIRELEVTDVNNCSRIIYQYHFTAWPDHGTPKEPTSILAFVIDINKKMNLIMQSKNKPEKNILCVHCSAGVGRTGTFIVLDMIINKINMTGLNSEMDVSNTVKWVRNQRAGMVQNKSQYKFIHQAIREYIDCYCTKKVPEVPSLNL